MLIEIISNKITIVLLENKLFRYGNICVTLLHNTAYMCVCVCVCDFHCTQRQAHARRSPITAAYRQTAAATAAVAASYTENVWSVCVCVCALVRARICYMCVCM